MNDWFEIFREGIHTDSGGETREWTRADLEHIADSYDAAEHEAPIVVGHPATDSPAFGWIEKVKHEGGRLLAKAKEVMPQFAKLVREGRYKKVSIKLDGENRLRHIGFLGGAAPAVEGLAPVQFSDEDAGPCVESEFYTEGNNVPEEPDAANRHAANRHAAFSEAAARIGAVINQSAEDGKLTPAQKALAEQLVQALREGAVDGGSTFSESHAGSAEHNTEPFRLFGEFLASLPRQPLFSEVLRRPREKNGASILDRASELIRSHSLFS